MNSTVTVTNFTTHVQRRFASGASLEWVLRIGAFLCFVGHGAFGIIGKEAWLPYFGVVGIGASTGRSLEPWIGALDITSGILMLVTPRKAVAWWMVAWTIWTAMLRPLSGEPVWEMLERGGNYGVPSAIVVLMMPALSFHAVFAPAKWRPLDEDLLRRARIVLTICVACLLVGHGALSLTAKKGLLANYGAIMPAAEAAAVLPYLGWLEILLGVGVIVRPSVPLMLFIAVWKLATEMLFIAAGASFWEVVERGGSYAGPIALAIVMAMGARRRASAVARR